MPFTAEDQLSAECAALTESLNRAREVRGRWIAVTSAITMLRHAASRYDAPIPDSESTALSMISQLCSKMAKSSDGWIDDNQRILDGMISRLIGS